MNIQLIQGEFKSEDALKLISDMIQIKIKFHESKILENSNEEEIKYREGKIKKLQHTLSEFRNSIINQSGNIALDAIIQVNS